MFLRNHDELDLGRLTRAQQRKVFECFGPDKRMQLYERGIRRRLAPMLGADRRKLELAYSLMYTLPGTPVLRYGDELGMGDNLKLPERNCARTPMQWSDEPQAGFTKAKKAVLPVISQGPFGFQQVNAARQRRDPNSLLNWMERTIRMRKEVPEISWGDFRVIRTRNPSILIMQYQWRNNAVLIVHNFKDEAQEVSFSLDGDGGRKSLLISLLSEEHSKAGRDGRHRLALEPFGYRWFRVGGLDYLLRRSEIDRPSDDKRGKAEK